MPLPPCKCRQSLHGSTHHDRQAKPKQGKHVLQLQAQVHCGALHLTSKEWPPMQLATFRTGSHSLRVQTGRYDAVEFKCRTCDCCEHEIEDEMHAIFICPMHSSLRAKFADLFGHASDLHGFFAQYAIHRIALFLTECRALKLKGGRRLGR